MRTRGISRREWLRTGQVARAAGVSRETIRRAIIVGRLPAWRVGGTQYRVRPQDVDLMLVQYIPAREEGGLVPA